MPARDPFDLSRRERQALEILYELGSATAAELHERLPDPPGYSSVRSILRLLEEKGRVEHERDGAALRLSPNPGPRPRARARAAQLAADLLRRVDARRRRRLAGRRRPGSGRRATDRARHRARAGGGSLRWTPCGSRSR